MQHGTSFVRFVGERLVRKAEPSRENLSIEPAYCRKRRDNWFREMTPNPESHKGSWLGLARRMKSGASQR